MVIGVREETLEEKKIRIANKVAYKFRDESELSEAQLTDPDYSKKLIAIQAGLDPNEMLSCSKCHRCK